jgi:hypothetical protein
VITQHFKYDALFVFGRYGFLEPDEIKNNGYKVIKTETSHTVKSEGKGTKKDQNLVHVGVVDAHAAKDGESFDKVLVVLGEGQVVEFVD